MLREWSCKGVTGGYSLAPVFPLQGVYFMTGDMLGEERSGEGPNRITRYVKGQGV